MKASTKTIPVAYSVIVDYGGSDWNTTPFHTQEDAEVYVFEVAQDYLDDNKEYEAEEDWYKRLTELIANKDLKGVQELLYRDMHVNVYVQKGDGGK